MGKICGFSLLFATVNHTFVYGIRWDETHGEEEGTYSEPPQDGFGLVCYLFIYLFLFLNFWL